MRPLLILLALILAAPASAQVYRWTDENGVTHFGTQPPAGHQEQVQIRDSRPDPAASVGESDMVRRARALEREREASRLEHQIRQLERQIENRPDYVCTGAENRLKSAEERWAQNRRQGYTQNERQYHEQLIRDYRRHRDNVCR